MAAGIEREFEKWQEQNADAGVVFVEASARRATFLLGDDEFEVLLPAHTVQSGARRLSDWAKAVTKRVAKDAKKRAVTLGDVLSAAVATPVSTKKKPKKKKEEEDAGADADAADAEMMMVDDEGEGFGAEEYDAELGGGGGAQEDFDLEGAAFQEGLEVLKMKKRWAAKEAELRLRLQADGGAATDRSRIKQIFSSTAALGVLTNDLLLIRNDASGLGFSAEPVDDNIYDWRVRIFGFRQDTQIAKDITAVREQYGYDYVELRVSFTLDLYPFYPPMVRVVRPRFHGFMMGRVTSMEILRLSGWDPIRDMRGVLQAIRTLLEEHGKLDVHNPMNDIASHPGGAYTELEFLLLRLELLCETPARVHAKYPELAPTPTRQQLASSSASPAAAAAAPRESGGRKLFWARGTGYGTDRSGDSRWDVNAYLAAQQQKDNETGSVLRSIAGSLKEGGPGGVAFDVLEESCLIPVLESYLRNDSILDMVQHIALYMAVFQVCEALAMHEEWLPLFEQLPNQARSVLDLLRTQNVQAKVLLSTTSGAAVVAAGPGMSEEQLAPIRLATTITNTFSALERNIEKVSASIRELESTRQTTAVAAAAAAPTETISPEQAYIGHMKELQFDACAIDVTLHHYASHASGAPANKAKVLRLAQEQASIAISLPLARDSGIFVRVSEDRIDYMRALITGPSASDLGDMSTPYAGGCFVFDIFFPATYPNSPPLVNLCTTGHGSVRFNPNLYNDGKVCISLLGTWSGAEGETWNPKTSTLLQVLVSIQSLIFVPKPYFNEPGFEQQMGTSQGDRANRQYNEVIRTGTLEHAIIEQLRSPTPGFEEVIRRHFYLMQDRIVAQANRWADEANAHSSKAHYSKLLRLIREMQAEFAKLSFPFPKLPI